LRHRLASGEVASVADLVTHNLDLARFAEDMIAQIDDPDMLRAFWTALTSLSVLDPTCGAGAFLLAALDILEPLYAACLERMQDFPVGPDRRAFIVRTIIENNLYGVDLLPEAVEVCKLRLFHRLAAQAKLADPLALLREISFNVRVGNALSGFDWSAEFPDVMRRGGFHAVIGNPPYIAARQVRQEYDVPELRTRECPDVYAWCLERAAALVADNGCSGMIVPLSLGFSADFGECRRLLFETYRGNWFSSFGRIPSALFKFDIRVRNMIHIGHRQGDRGQHTTRLHRWFDAERPQLLQLLEYVPFEPGTWQGRIPKLGGARLAAVLERCLTQTRGRLADSFSRAETPHRLHFKKTAYNWLNFCKQMPPCLDAAGKRITHTQFSTLYLRSAVERDLAFLFLNGKIAFCFWAVVGDDFHVANWMFGDFSLALDEIPSAMVRRLLPLAGRLERTMRGAVSFKRNAGKRVGNYNLARCRHVTDCSDALFARHLGLEDVLPEVELLYRQVVRTEFDTEEVPVRPSSASRSPRPRSPGTARP
jgi:hypothetical protein